MPRHKPSQEAKCLTLLNRERSGPTSAMTFSAVPVSMPSIRVRSTPQARNNAVRRSNLARLLGGRPRRLGGSTGAVVASQVAQHRRQPFFEFGQGLFVSVVQCHRLLERE